MRLKTKRWLLILAVLAGAGLASLVIAAYVVSRQLDPYIREQAIRYLQQRFDSEVELSALRVRVPGMSPVRMIFDRGKGTKIRVEGEDLAVRYQGRRDIPPMFVLERFSFEVDMGTLFEDKKIVDLVTIDGMQVHIPPKGERPSLPVTEDSATPGSEPQSEGGPETNVLIQQIRLNDSVLTILPRNPDKIPLKFELHSVLLESAGTDVAMRYDAELTNAKPPGQIHSTGTFGPWSAAEPGDTPVTGSYTFDEADLGVFSGIAGILNSTGDFSGTLSAINVKGEASVPEFKLKRSGNPVPLKTRFEVLVDGTNGDTILQPVEGTIGSAAFTTSGGIVKHETAPGKLVSLDVLIPKGSLADILRLAMKGAPFMEGDLFLKTKIDIPPLTGKVRERLLLDGTFEVSRAKFLRSNIQTKIDELSRRGQGQPKNMEIDEVVSVMAGRFSMENERITFLPVSFAVEGAGVDLSGVYDLDKDTLDFRGTLKLRAKVSQTMSGWKRWVLKPIDPFFSKQGAGTLLRIKVDGSAKAPKFGLDRD
jgi:hypothetical protein